MNQLARGIGLLALFGVAAAATAVDTTYHQTVSGVAVYIGIVPSELIRGHPAEHPEGAMHGGPVAGENHLVVAVFDDKTRRRLTGLEVSARITGGGKLDARKKLEPMAMAGAMSYGNYFFMPGAGPYRIEIEIVIPGKPGPIRVPFTWARS